MDDLFASFNQMKVAVIGDVMLDTYWWGKVERISPEAPVPIVAVSKREKRIGGAGNVALNLLEMGASVSLLSVTGNDEDGVELQKLLSENNVNTSYIIKSDNRVTTNKIRIISRNQQMMRLDAEHSHDISEQEEDRFIERVGDFINEQKPHVVILEDYNKGVLTERVIHEVIEICIAKNIPIAVDPKRKNFFCYKKVTLIKPNFIEATSSLNIIADECSLPVLHDIHAQLKEKLDHKISLITLSEKGIFYEADHQHNIIPSHRRNISDVSGAGDTVISVATLVYAATKDIELTAQIANIAGGIVCEEVGTVPVNKQKLLSESKRLLR